MYYQRIYFGNNVLVNRDLIFLQGVVFPLDKKGERSTSTAGKMAIAAAIRAANTPDSESLAVKCENEKNWRFNYNKHFMNLVKVSAFSPEAALASAKAGIKYMHENFGYADPKNPTSIVPFSEYMKNAFLPYHTGVINGALRSSPAVVLSVPYQGKTLSDSSLRDQLTAWAEYGTIEPDAAASISSVSNGPLDLTGQNFVLIGAGSAMGPFSKLLEHGATVIAIDIPGVWGEGPQKMWNRLISVAKNSRGQLIFPLSAEQSSFGSEQEMLKACGCNLIEEPGRILAWLKTIQPGSRLVVGNYTYLDSDMHVKLSLAADAIIQGICMDRSNAAVAFLCTPTDIHIIPAEANAAARKNYGFHPGKVIETVIQMLSFGKFLKKNATAPLIAQDGSKIHFVDGLSVAQGPNYALAKRLQHWRAMVAYDDNHVVSSNIAPSTATLSVVSNRTFAWAYGGMPYFKPFEIFQQETTNAIMAALLIANVTNKASAVR